MSGYTKLFSSIVASTIWREPDHVRVIWITMLAMATKDGIVEASVPGLADMARVTLDQCEQALAVLRAPDPYSRTKEHEGRRIDDVDGGFLLLNHAKYRDKLSAEDRRERDRQWRASYRASGLDKGRPVESGRVLVESGRQMSSRSLHTAPAPAPAPEATHTPTPSETGVCVFPLKAKFQADTRFSWLEGELCRFYKRPRPTVSAGEEQHLVAEVSRRPDVKAELDELRRCRSEIGERYFPQSLLALCRDWDKTLDRARNHAPAPKSYKEKSIFEKELDRLEKEVEREQL